MRLKRPDIIIFDYGKTLGTSDGFDFSRGISAMWEHISKNPDNVPPAEAEAFVKKIYEKLDVHRAAGCEIPQQNEMRLAYEYLGIEFDVPYEALEEIFMENGSQAYPVKYVEELLAYLSRAGIRKAVVSNINWRGDLLKKRIEKILPDAGFEFVMASSEYVIRKPDKMLFEIALKKAGVPAEKAWYVGNETEADIYGSHGAGMFPVWLSYGREKPDTGFDYLAVKDHRELIGVMERL